MKTVIVQINPAEMQRLIERFEPGDALELTDGDRRLAFQAETAGAAALENEEGRPELAAEFLLGHKVKPASYTREDLQAFAKEIRLKKDGGKNTAL